jgi:hypothetical protein
VLVADVLPGLSSCSTADEIVDSDDSPAVPRVDKKIGTSRLRLVGSNSDSITEGKCIADNAIVQQKAMEEDSMRQFKVDLVVGGRGGVTQSLHKPSMNIRIVVYLLSQRIKGKLHANQCQF